MFSPDKWFTNPSAGFYPHTIDQSLRFDAVGYLTRNTGEAGNTTVYTTSFWVKRSGLTSHQYIFSAGPWNGGNNFEGIRFVNDDTLRAILTVSNSTVANFTTNAKFRDVSAWYHIVWQRNGQAYKIYVNGTEQTYSTSTFSSNPNGYLTADTEQLISGRLDHAQDLNGYLAEFHFVDGSALDPTSFGETKDGVWIPKAYSGSYGTTGFHLNFSDSSSIGADSSGLSHNFTVSGLVASDVVPDSPTNNFATINANFRHLNLTLSKGNLKHSTSTNNRGVVANFLLPKSGKWYWEHWSKSFNYPTDNEIHAVGINVPTVDIDGSDRGGYNTGITLFSKNGEKNVEGTRTAYDSITGWDENEGCSVLFDADANTISWSVNGGAFGSTVSVSDKDWIPYVGMGGGTSSEVGFFNFGQDGTFAGETTSGGYSDANGIGDFKWQPPSGALALCTSNLPDVTIGPGQTEQADDNFNIILYTGDADNDVTVTNTFAADWVWLKRRSGTDQHFVQDIVRGFGASKSLSPSTNGAEAYNGSFQSSQNIVTTSSSLRLVSGDFAVNSATYVAWTWKAGGGADTFNIDGTGYSSASDASLSGGDITPTGASINTTAGLSIISYTGNGGAITGQTIKHGLSSAPELIFIKDRDTNSNNNNWQASSSVVGDDYAYLSTTAQFTGSALMKPTSGDATTVTLGIGSNTSIRNTTNESGDDFIMYCFHSVEGYSKVGSYNGNAQNYSNGTFVYTGFRPSLVTVKASSTTGDWVVTDNKRASSFNGDTARLYWSANHAETGYSSNRNIELFSNGFMVHGNSAGSTTNRINESANYIFYAVAEAPVKFANAR